MKKRIIKIFALVFCMTFVFSGCGSNADFSRGKWQKDVYTNEFFNLKYTKPEFGDNYNDENLSIRAGFDVASADLEENEYIPLVYVDAIYFFIDINVRKKGSETDIINSIMETAAQQEAFSRTDSETFTKNIGKNKFTGAKAQFVYPSFEGEEPVVYNYYVFTRQVKDYSLVITANLTDGLDIDIILSDFS